MNLILSSSIILLFLCISTAESTDPSYYSCNQNTKTTNNSQISRNIDTLLSKLVQSTIQNGFTATSYGEGKDEIYGLAQCRGDVSKNDCSICIKDAQKYILNLCPSVTDAKIWYDYCFMRYNTVNFFGQIDTSGIYFINVENVTDPVVFNQKLGALMNQISSEAVKPENKGLGKEKSDISPFVRLYGLVQCHRDLSDVSCAQCLAIAIGNLPVVCGDKKGCRVLYGSCYVRYELYPFFFPLDSRGSTLDSSSVKDKYFMVTKP